MESRYQTIDALRQGKTIDIQGIKLQMDDGEIRPGDLYVAERNTGPHLLTAKKINLEIGCIFPTDDAYPYNLHECVKVREA